MIKVPDSMVLLNCGQCQHVADLFDFTATPVGGDLPRGSYQCPSCRYAWKMTVVEPAQFFESGLVIPPTVKPIRIPTAL